MKYLYKECINNEDNKFLKDEIGMFLYEIVIIEKEIKIVFF